MTLGPAQLYFTPKNVKRSLARQIPTCTYLSVKLNYFHSNRACLLTKFSFALINEIFLQPFFLTLFQFGLELFAVVPVPNVTGKKYFFIVFRGHRVGEFSSLWQCWWLSFCLIYECRSASTLISRAFHSRLFSRIIHELITCNLNKCKWDEWMGPGK